MYGLNQDSRITLVGNLMISAAPDAFQLHTDCIIMSICLPQANLCLIYENHSRLMFFLLDAGNAQSDIDFAIYSNAHQQLMKNKLHVATGQVLRNSDVAGNVIIQINYVLESNLKASGMNAAEMKIGTEIRWNTKALRPAKEGRKYSQNDNVKLFYNDLNIGIGKIVEGIDETVLLTHVTVTDIFPKNYIKAQHGKDFAVGDIVEWSVSMMEPHGELPRKKKRNPENWIKNVEKSKKRKGLAYKNSKGENKSRKLTVTQFDVIEKCSGKCMRKCPEEISNEQQVKIRNSYWAIESEEAKISFVRDLIIREEKSVSRVKPGTESRRKYTFKYYLPGSDNDKTNVCLDMFLKTFGITERRVKTIRAKKYDENLNYEQSLRHGHSNKAPNNKLPDSVTCSINEHIKLFPTVPSHYRRQTSKKHFFEKHLTKTKMCQLYNEQPGVTQVSNFTYNGVLNQYNIGFHKPQKDACTRCTQFKNSEKTEEINRIQEKHMEDKEMAREEKERDTKRAQNCPSFIAVIGDLEQVSPCPKANSSEFFYVSKVSCYNYTLYNLGTKDGYCYRWNETKAKRGADEIASCIHHFLTNVAGTATEVVIWSDTCSGQNRNQYLTAILLNIIQDQSNSIKTIQLKYFEPGHSQSEVDSIHSCLENAVRLIEVYDPCEYVSITKAARPSQPYQCFLLGTDDCPVYNTKEYAKKNIINRTKYMTEDGKMANASWMSAKVIKHGFFEGSLSADCIGLMTSFHHDESVAIVKTRQSKKSLRNSECYGLDVLYNDDSEPLPISGKKVKKLLDLVRGNTIPRPYHRFYLGLNGADTNEEESELEDEDE